MSHVIIGPHLITFDQIRIGQWPEMAQYFKNSLKFCQDWLNGQESFSINTSGSTGKPKTIQVSRKQMILSAEATRRFFQIQNGDRLLCCLHTDLVAGKMMLVRSMVWNCPIHIETPNSKPLKEFPSCFPLDFVAMVPYQVENTLLDPNSLKAFKNIKNLIIGGAPISATLQKKISQWPVNLYQTYGMTETVSHIALAKINGDGNLVYKSLPGVSISTTETHQLVIKAPMASQDTLTTNDLAEMVSENEFIWKGRADFTVNSGGIKIQPELLESKIQGAMSQFFPDSRYFFGGLPHDLFGEQLVLVIEMKNQDHMPSVDFSDSLKSSLDKFENPKKIHFIENFAETQSGKINRKETLDKLYQSINTGKMP
ncbi:AMP-binding protein [Echinicola jeungdonensis]|uniref:AMP-binding protein n=1 Tax=Echinicola jeungdonensis TaxID=709343 RepID=A0ABV5J6I3_9BACT|nr:AMP-binding protein [Echinicola jeungdonensis]MDN3670095.1 AMP-binding protein [Echinicola jeungdonensis]